MSRESIRNKRRSMFKYSEHVNMEKWNFFLVGWYALPQVKHK